MIPATAPISVAGSSKGRNRGDRLLLAFPGQGTDPRALRAVLATYRERPLVSMLAETLGTDDFEQVDLGDTRVAQPCLLTASLTRAAAVDDGRVQACIGHSVGEIAAAAHAGVITEAEALDLVVIRGRVTHEQHAAHVGGMAAVMGLGVYHIEWACRAATQNSGEPVGIAAYNSPFQTVVSGGLAGLDAIGRIVTDLGGLIQHLDIGGAFHSALMLGATEELTEALSRLAARDPVVPIISTVDAAIHTAGRALLDLQALALLLPVRWVEACEVARSAGLVCGVDVGPGSTLMKLGKRGGVLEFARMDEVAERRSEAGRSP